ncbi:MAG: phosphoglucosamine mutase [candidate division Zixibacteria bacterium]|nr:phosphoglucosamine mutase [candidate division Zixibacteria bacterium]MCI0597415.1 phosphoglucosamine mutase [candidate division Zixibacteria bacterium]
MKSKPKPLVSVSGVRGIVGESLTPEIITTYTAAFARLIKKGTVAVGRDTRPSGVAIENLVVDNLMAAGIDVLTLGIVPTPTLEMVILEKKLTGGVMVTASHNPAEWNALKFFGPESTFLAPKEVEKLKKLAKTSRVRKGSGKQGKKTSWEGAVEAHIEKILALELVKEEKIAARRFKVVVDCVNGAGYYALPLLLEGLGCEVAAINVTPDGRFPHNPEPIPENLGQLEAKVRELGADLGMATDPDADRLALVSAAGKAVGEEYTLVLAVDYVLSQTPGPVAVNLSTSQMNDEVAKKYGVKCFRTPVGEAHVALAFKKYGGVIGGEGNGGVILPQLHPGRDALVGAALILSHLAESGKTLAQAVDALPRFSFIKAKGTLAPNSDIKGKLVKIEKLHRNGRKDKRDGLWLGFPEGWFQVRLSNTEPIWRLAVEGRQDWAEAKARELKKLLTG